MLKSLVCVAARNAGVSADETRIDRRLRNRRKEELRSRASYIPVISNFRNMLHGEKQDLDAPELSEVAYIPSDRYEGKKPEGTCSSRFRRREQKNDRPRVSREQLLHVSHENTGCLTNLFNLSSRSVPLHDPISRLPKAEDT